MELLLDLLPIISLWLACLPLANVLSTCPNCCGGGCSKCEPSGGNTTIGDVEVTFTGVANGTCGGGLCAATYNTTFILSFVSEVGDTCSWRYNGTDPELCNTDGRQYVDIIFQVVSDFPDPGDTYIQVSPGRSQLGPSFPSYDASFGKSYIGSQPSCALTAESLPLTSSVGFCDWSAATCAVTFL